MPVKHRKPKAKRVEEVVRVRLTSKQASEALTEAERIGLSLSAWVRQLVIVRLAEAKS